LIEAATTNGRKSGTPHAEIASRCGERARRRFRGCRRWSRS